MEQIEEQINNTQESSINDEEKSNLIDLKNLDGGLEILVELAEKGDIDPWDVDIVEITNKYLTALNSTPRENLLNAGRAIFYASVLLRMKSEILLDLANNTLSDSQEAEILFPEDAFLNDEEIHIDNSQLESFINRSSLGKQQRKRKIILSDLIFALQQAEDEENRRSTRARIRAERNAHQIVALDISDDVLEIAHEEDIEDIVERIESIVEEHLTDEKPITFSYLSNILNDKVKPFLSLLFMAHRGSVVLEQNGDYGEILIHRPGKITQEMIEQDEANKQAEAEEKERLKKAKDKKKRKRITDKVKSKIKSTAQMIKDKIIGAKELKSIPTNNISPPAAPASGISPPAAPASGISPPADNQGEPEILPSLKTEKVYEDENQNAVGQTLNMIEESSVTTDNNDEEEKNQ